MDRELGMNPKKFGKIANHKQEPWKALLPAFIENLYFKRFGKKRPGEVKSIEQMAKIQEKKLRRYDGKEKEKQESKA